MRVLLVTESYWPNTDGGAVFERSLAQFLAHRGHHITIIAPATTTTMRNSIQHDHDTTIYRVSAVPLIFNRNYRVSLWPYFQVKKRITEFKPDIIHIHNPALLGLSAMRIARRRKIPTIATNHFMPENIFNAVAFWRFAGILEKGIQSVVWKLLVWFHNKATIVTSPTPTAQQIIQSHGLRVPSYVISNGVDLTRFSPFANEQEKLTLKKKYRIPLDRPIILYIGRLDSEKRLDILCHAMAEVARTTDAHLVIGGTGKERSALEKIIRDHQIGSRVTFVGRIPDVDLPNYYRLADVFAISSPAELQSIVTLEALASGLPVVAVDKGALSEIVHHERNGLLFPYPDSHAMAQSLIRLVTHPELRAQFSIKSHEIVRAHDSQVAYSQYEKLFQQLVSSK